MLKGIQLAQRRQPTMVHDVIIPLDLLEGRGLELYHRAHLILENMAKG